MPSSSRVEHVFEAFGDAFVEAGGGGGVFTAEGAPFVDLVGGGAVGDAEAVVFFEPSSLTGAAIFPYAFTEIFRQFSFLLKYGCHLVVGMVGRRWWWVD